MRASTQCVQIHGGYGYIKEYPVERYLRDSKITTIYEGSNEIMHIVIASQIVASGADGLRELVDELIEKIDFSGDLGLHGSVITESHFYRTKLMNRLEFYGWRKADFRAVFGGLVVAGAAAEPEELVKFTVTND